MVEMELPVEKILSHRNFDKMSPNDIYRIIRTKADKINTVINAGEEAVRKLTNKNSAQIDKYLEKPNFGLPFPRLYICMVSNYLGLERNKSFIWKDFLSNEGKTRKLILLAAYVALVQDENFFLMSNEMDEEDLR